MTFLEGQSLFHDIAIYITHAHWLGTCMSLLSKPMWLQPCAAHELWVLLFMVEARAVTESIRVLDILAQWGFIETCVLPVLYTVLAMHSDEMLRNLEKLLDELAKIAHFDERSAAVTELDLSSVSI